ncbi:CoA-binding protein [Magnetococcus sp. PR-3]|uniref:CoA-binding protein n=1 Tax=Magnetococcus sp. PR-3 TaxID=3120355 RepID=UPI002FCE4ECD
MSDELKQNLNEGYNTQLAKGVSEFPYYVGIHSLADMATKDDRVCVLNILGGESRSVTPTSHVFSGGNIVCGTQPGRSGSKLKTAAGDIPVYSNVLEAVEAGHKFNCAVVYVPPAGVKDAVIEAVRVVPDLKKVIILTEKVAVKDARIIRAYCQVRGVDVLGANCLGVADAHNKVRLGGALGGANPEESLIPGSVSIFSNSGNFTTTIAVYLATAGWGTTTSVSSGKDVYIHYAAPEYTHAMHNDDRTKAAVLYVEPGGYYEHDLEFEKPVVACIVGRWKAKLTRSCGHAGAIAGAGDNALAKEEWFMEKFGVDSLFTPENPVCSAKGAVVTNIAHIPQAMTMVMEKRGEKPDFAPHGDLSLKCWFENDQGLTLPENLAIKQEEALAPYDSQIEALSKQVGTVFPRQNMKDASGASKMDPKTQVSSIHSTSVLDASTHTLEENLAQSLIREYPDATSAALMNVALNSSVNQHGQPGLAAADASREAGSSPNVVLSTAVGMVGPNMVRGAREATDAMIELFGRSKIIDPSAQTDCSAQVDAADAALFTTDADDGAAAMLAGCEARSANSVFVNFVKQVAAKAGKQPSRDGVLAAIALHVAWRPLMRKRLSRTTVVNMPWHMQIFSTMVGSAVAAADQSADRFAGIANSDLINSWSFSATAFLSLFGRKPEDHELYSFSVLLGLIITNGPGTISAQGAKGAVSADGPEVSDRIQINKGYIGFLTHTGFAHGGNGFEAIAFLVERFKDSGLTDPGQATSLDLSEMALGYAKEYKKYKAKAKAEGDLNYFKVPCINHPVFKNKDVNYDPREQFVNGLFKKRGDYNVFLDYYHELVNGLYKAGVSKNVYCVNVDAVIAVILLKMLWGAFSKGEISNESMESAAFTTFLFGRMIGTAAEVDDHTNRGKNMDTRTAASKVTNVG